MYQVTGTFFLTRIKHLTVWSKVILNGKTQGRACFNDGKLSKKGDSDHNLVVVTL